MLIRFRSTPPATCSWLTRRVMVSAAAILLAPAGLSALDPSRPISHYPRTVWQGADGLPQNSVTSIVQTRDGYLWLGTLEGLVRFDGIRFSVFDSRAFQELASNRITALCEDRDGRLWVGTEGGGLSYFDGTRIHACALPRAPGLDLVRSLAVDGTGALWIATAGGLLRRTGDRIDVFDATTGLPSSSISSVVASADGDVWAGTALGGLVRLSGGKVEVYDHADGLSSDAVYCLAEDSRGRLWIGTARGLSCFADGRFTRFGPRDGLTGDVIWSLHADREGSIWIGTNGGGLNRLQDGRITSLTAADGLSSDFIWSLLTDREGNLWVGTNGGGLNRLRDSHFTCFSAGDGLANDFAWCVLEDTAGSVWVGTSDGLSRYRDGRFETFGRSEGLSNPFVYSLAEDARGRLWVGTNGGGMACLDGGRFVRYAVEDGLAGDRVWDIHAEKDGSLWVGTATGLSHYRDGRFTNYDVRDGLPSANVRAVHRDRTGTLWIGTTSGVARMDGRRFVPCAAEDGLAQRIVRVLREDTQGNLWIGMQDGGLSRLVDGRFRTYGTRQGLLDDTVSQLLEDGSGNLWMSCNRGVFVVRSSDFDRFDRGDISKIPCLTYGTADGMRSQECNGSSQPAGWRCRNGSIWFPTVRGVAIIDPARIRTNPYAPPVVIEGLTADGVARDVTGLVEIGPGIDRIEIQYTGLSLSAPERVLFRYRMEGHDREWLDAGTRRTASYTNLPPGRYRLRVTACNNDRVWNAEGASLELLLKPRFYQTTWFLIACVLAAATAAWGLYTLRVRQIKARFEAVLVERHRIAQEIHDTMAQGLTGMSIQLEALGDSLPTDLTKARRILDRSRDQVRSSLGDVRRLVWDLRPRVLEDRNVAQALQEMVAETTRGTPIQARVQIEGEPRPLPARTETNLLRIGQEAVTNAVRHAGCRRVEVEIEFGRDIIRLRIRDDGRGFTWPLPAAQSEGHFGVVGMQERARQIDGELRLRSSPGEGTEIEVVAPIRA